MNKEHISRLAHLSAYLHENYIDNNDVDYQNILSTHSDDIFESLHIHVVNKYLDVQMNPSTTLGISVEEAEFYTLMSMIPKACTNHLSSIC